MNPPDLLGRLVRPEIQSLPGYEPVEPLEEWVRRTGIARERVAKLDGNENLHGLHPVVRAALAEDEDHLYPDPDQRTLREAIAGYAGCAPEQVVAGAGSDDLLDLVIRAVVRPGDRVIDCTPTFGMYPFLARIAGAEVVEAPRHPETWEIDPAAVAEQVDMRARVVFVATPNNPTGNLTSPRAIEDLLRLPVLVVLDEAYGEFAGVSNVARVAEHPNLVVTRTFSKWAGLAGLRAGYAVMHPWLAERLMTIKQPYNVNTAAYRAALAALRVRHELTETVRAIVAERDRLAPLLRATGFLDPYPSQANFVLCRVKGDARALQGALRERGVLVRYFRHPAVADCVRISVARRRETDLLMRALEEAGRELGYAT